MSLCDIGGQILQQIHLEFFTHYHSLPKGCYVVIQKTG